MISPTSELAMQWARTALEQYELRQPSIVFLGHSDNLTFRVEEPGGTLYLLRLHQPVLRYWRGIRQKPEVIAAELEWLEALAWEGHFTVQQPVRTRSGELVALISRGLSAPESTQGGDEAAPLPATLLTWLEGEHFSPAAPNAPSIVENYGALVARLHAFSTTWEPPAGLARPAYDLAHFRRVLSRLVRGVDQGFFTDEIYRTLRATIRKLLEQISLEPDDRQHWGMIHADLHMGNFLVQGSQAIPIDFSFCGLGHYAFDLSICLAGGLHANLRPNFLAGYRAVRALPEDDLAVVGAYALAGRLSYYAYQIDNPVEREWLRRRLPEVAHHECARYLAGESILWSL